MRKAQVTPLRDTERQVRSSLPADRHCLTKSRFNSLGNAREAAARINRKGYGSQGTQIPYWCESCHFLHVGKAKPTEGMPIFAKDIFRGVVSRTHWEMVCTLNADAASFTVEEFVVELAKLYRQYAFTPPCEDLLSTWVEAAQKRIPFAHHRNTEDTPNFSLSTGDKPEVIEEEEEQPQTIVAEEPIDAEEEGTEEIVEEATTETETEETAPEMANEPTDTKEEEEDMRIISAGLTAPSEDLAYLLRQAILSRGITFLKAASELEVSKQTLRNWIDRKQVPTNRQESVRDFITLANSTETTLPEETSQEQMEAQAAEDTEEAPPDGTISPGPDHLIPLNHPAYDSLSAFHTEVAKKINQSLLPPSALDEHKTLSALREQYTEQLAGLDAQAEAICREEEQLRLQLADCSTRRQDAEWHVKLIRDRMEGLEMLLSTYDEKETEA
jgi:hypothetical protein